MKELIVQIIRHINKEKDDGMKRPIEATENEVRAELSREVTVAINELIADGVVKVNGTTINKIRLLKA
jgi:hypothetical protein